MKPTPTPLPDAEAIRAAARVLAQELVATPLVPAGPGMFLKLESLQATGSFKARGVLHAVARMDPERRRRGLSTASAGNTARALALAARRFGTTARSLIPDTAPRAKIDAFRRLGGEPVLLPAADLFRWLAEERWRAEPYAFVDPWHDPDLLAGHGTLGLEIAQACPDVAEVFVPVGGGGLALGVAAALRHVAPAARVVAVEPEACAALHASLRAGAPVSVPCRTVCDGVAIPFVTLENFERLREAVSGVELVAEDDVRRAIRDLALQHKVVAEGAGALAFAAARRLPPASGPRVAIVSGGNIDPALLAELLHFPEATPS